MAIAEAPVRPRTSSSSQSHQGPFINEPFYDFRNEDNARKMRAAIEPFKALLARTEKERDEARQTAFENSRQVQSLEKKLTDASLFLNGWKNGNGNGKHLAEAGGRLGASVLAGHGVDDARPGAGGGGGRGRHGAGPPSPARPAGTATTGSGW